MGFLEAVFLVLLVLKLTGLAAVSWLWVFTPLIVAAGIYVAWALIVLGIVLVKH